MPCEQATTRPTATAVPLTLERRGSGLGAIHDHVVPTGIRRIEPVAVEIEVADSRMTHVVDSQAITYVGAVPQFAETWADLRQFGYQRLSCEYLSGIDHSVPVIHLPR